MRLSAQAISKGIVEKYLGITKNEEKEIKRKKLSSSISINY